MTIERHAGRFLLLGSASGELLRQTGESLAGRVSYVELTPLCANEVENDMPALQTLWLRGGCPLSCLAVDEWASFQWRQDFMLAHLQGQLFNASQLGLSLGGESHTTAARYLDTLVDTLMVRRLGPHPAKVGKQLVKSPKVYGRDGGLLKRCSDWPP